MPIPLYKMNFKICCNLWKKCCLKVFSHLQCLQAFQPFCFKREPAIFTLKDTHTVCYVFESVLNSINIIATDLSTADRHSCYFIIKSKTCDKIYTNSYVLYYLHARTVTSTEKRTNGTNGNMLSVINASEWALD